MGGGRPGAGRRFQRNYRSEGIELLAEADELRGTLSGPAMLVVCKRAWEVFGDERFRRLAEQSNGHPYNLRRSPGYVRRMSRKDPTRPAPVTTAGRRHPRPQGRAGYLRVDSVR